MLAHVDGPDTFSWTSWDAEPSVIIGVFLLAGLYLYSIGPLREKYQLADEVSPWRILSFLLGVWFIFFALTSPLNTLSDHFLFSAHMVQHLILIEVVPPLLLLGTPDWLLDPILGKPRVYRVAKFFTFPVVVFVVFNLTFIIWHVPTFYDAGLNHLSVHIFQHLLFLATGVLLWWPVLSQSKILPRLPDAGRVLYLFILSIPPGIVGGLITFTNEPLYETYIQATRIWGLDPIEDQQIGGVMMKLPGFLLFIAAAAIIFFRWAAREEARDRAEAEERRRRYGRPRPPADEHI